MGHGCHIEIDELPTASESTDAEGKEETRITFRMREERERERERMGWADRESERREKKDALRAQKHTG